MFKKTLVALAVLGASASAQSVSPSENSTQVPKAAAVVSADSAVVTKDKRTGKLRPATAQEQKELQDEAAATAVRAAPAPTLQKFHASGATGARLTDEFMSTSIAVRNADGKIVKQCIDGNHAGHTHAQPVTQLETE